MASRMHKLIIVFLTAAVTINLANYFFYWLFFPHVELPFGYIQRFVVKLEKKEYKCPEVPPRLAEPITYKASMFRLPVENIYTEIGSGGLTKVKKCKSLQKAAIIIPFIGPNIPLAFINYLHSFLMTQQLDYQVFAVEQNNETSPYNRGKLINAAFTEIDHRYNRGETFHCFIVHEPNIVPVDSRNLYRCCSYPKQLAAVVQKADNAKLGWLNFGGALALTYEQYIKVNGLSNVYWNNNSVYEDMFNRLKENYRVVRTSTEFGKYIILENMISLLQYSSEVARTTLVPPQYKIDGLNSLSYVVHKFEMRDVYTYINIKVAEDPNDIIMTWIKSRNIHSFHMHKNVKRPRSGQS